MHKKTKRPKSDKKVQIDKHAKAVTRSLKVEKARNALINTIDSIVCSIVLGIKRFWEIEVNGGGSHNIWGAHQDLPNIASE